MTVSPQEFEKNFWPALNELRRSKFFYFRPVAKLRELSNRTGFSILLPRIKDGYAHRGNLSSVSGN